MRALAPPDPDAWRRRAEWFWRAHDANAGPHPLDPGPRAQLLLAELELAFCAGAWVASVLLAWALVEGELRAAAAEEAGGDVDWLRERRNALAHLAPGGDNREAPGEAELEEVARGAVRVAFKELFAGGWR